ncbi:hypothetical protein ACFWY9_16535 [Amycolatopsis sp. NPDC059027]|uniref:hypothetical protein n=1 Tax=Amycolatopsis sp. NPDC059027 TaxID=3346709 RepID=UPI00366CCFD2
MTSANTPTEGGRTRIDAVVAWTAAHAAELAGIGLPGIGALVWTPWLGLVSGAVAVWWALNEYRDHRAVVQLREGSSAPRQLEATGEGRESAGGSGEGEREVRA